VCAPDVGGGLRWSRCRRRHGQLAIQGRHDLSRHQRAVIEYVDGAGSSKTIAEFSIAGLEKYRGPFLAPYDVSPDDKRFLFLRETTPNERNEIIVAQNWTQEMKDRAQK
jgi:hypothetical protein